MYLNSTFSTENRQTLLLIAKKSIHYGSKFGHAVRLNLKQYLPEIAVPCATFVTLKKNAILRGCIGTLTTVRPLVEDVSHNAYAAAFSDPRFPPVEANELNELEIHISVLSPPEEIHFESEQDLISRLRPTIDGLILDDGSRKGTFLPSVWESLSNPTIFVKQLKEKAGMPENYWPDSIKAYRYTVESIDADSLIRHFRAYL